MTPDYDARFWLGFYRWAISTPLMRSIRSMAWTLELVADEIGSALLPATREATWAIQDFGYAIGQLNAPAHRPFSYRLRKFVSRKVREVMG